MRETIKLHIMCKASSCQTFQHYTALKDVGTGSVLQLAYSTKDVEEMQQASIQDVQQYTHSNWYGFSDWPGINTVGRFSFHFTKDAEAIGACFYMAGKGSAESQARVETFSKCMHA